MRGITSRQNRPITHMPLRRPLPTRPSAPALARILALCLLTALTPAAALADDALGGMDVVSLRDAGRVAQGGDDITTHWRGHEWHFANEANRATFEADPRAYAPGFGGACPVALANGERRPGQPDLFVVVGDTLYLASSPQARAALESDPAPVISAAKAQWKRLAR